MRKFWESLQVIGAFLLPFWFWLAMYLVIAPDGWLGRAIIVGFGLYFLGAIQLICLGFMAFFLHSIWTDKPRRQW